MTPEEFDEYYKAQPFVPFMIHLADGQGFYVPTNGYVAHKPGAWSFIVINLENAGFRVLNLNQVTTITYEAPPVESNAI